MALTESSAVVADPTENFIWLVEKGREPKRLVANFHGHWMTRGRDGNLYTEAFQERGGAWPSAAFRLEVPTGKVTALAEHDELRTLVFAVDRDGALVFQRGEGLVSRKDAKEVPFRATLGGIKVDEVTAYAWSGEDLIFADRNRLRRVDTKGEAKVIAVIEGKALEPKIWNSTELPNVFGLAVERNGDVLATVPHLAKVYRAGKEGRLDEVICNEGSWRATGVSVFDDSIFLMESDARASTSPRVRILRADGRVEILTLPPAVR